MADDVTTIETPTETVDEPEAAPGAGPEGLDRERVLRDYRVGVESRETSLLGRREALTGKAKFGIFGDGKEVAQLAMAGAFEKGDFRAGYYRDQTFMMALGLLSIREFFAQLYAHADVEAEPASAGRQMNSHFATRMLGEDGRFLDQTATHNVAADLSPTASQCPKLVGLAYASRLYRETPSLQEGFERFSRGGREVAWGTIGNASCAEGMFWEAVNAVGVLRSPMIMSIWDDGYGISVPNEHQVTKADVGALLEGFRRAPGSRDGYDIYKVRGWDYPELVRTYVRAADAARRDHVPALVHVVEVTQPQGHSTSGSHERYKSAERLEWEKDFCCLKRMRAWIEEQGLATAGELDEIETAARQRVLDEKNAAWDAYREPIDRERGEAVELLDALAAESPDGARVEEIARALAKKQNVFRRDLFAAGREALVAVAGGSGDGARRALVDWLDERRAESEARYNSDLHLESGRSALDVPAVAPEVDGANTVNGFEVLNAFFDQALARHPHLVAFGEDVGYLGDVNQGFAGLQEKHGPLRVSDTGIRETTIMGQAIGMALRGLRPIAEIQYLDYILYGLQILSDDLATLTYRTKGGQKAPVIVRTRGHRLEGIWHSGSPMAGIIHLVRGMRVCVPRDMTRAAGMYNTLLQSDDPAIVVEVLNGYRAKEPLPANLDEMTVPLGIPEVLREGSDVTVVSYGATLKIVLEAAELLAGVDVDVEVIDVQTLLPFDREHRIVQSLAKTNRVLFVDEDVPGGTTAYLFQQVLEVQGGWLALDAPPRTLSAQAHRPAYGSDGDYFSKPSREDVFDAVYELMHESDPEAYPLFYRS